MIVGLGTSIVETVRIGRLIQKYGERFLMKAYTEQEVRYCQERVEYLQHFTGRWAAKEAVIRSLGSGFSRDILWREIEILVTPTGHQVVKMHGGVRDLAERRNVQRFLLSIAHCRSCSTATALAMAGES